MNHRRQLAAALACALAIGLCAGNVLADGAADPAEITDAPEIIAPADSPETSGTAAESADGGTSADTQDAAESQATPDAAATASARKALIVEGERRSPDTTYEDAAGTVSFENLESRLRANNLNILALDESIESIEAIDLDEMEKNLKMAISMISAQQKQLERLADGTTAALEGLQSVLDGQNLGIDLSVFQAALVAYPEGTISALSTQIASYEETLDQLQDGTIEDEYDAVISQLMNAQDQIVMGAETLYLSLLGLEQTQQGLERNLASLDRTLAELEIRYEMGQISSLTLAEAKAGRTSLVSGMQTLEMNMTALRRQLEGMLGEEITGTIQLQPLTAVTAAELEAVDYENDLKDVKKYSYELESAEKTLDDAEDDWNEARHSDTGADYEVDSARYAKSSAELSLQATVQSIELSFATLCDQLKDQQQVLSAAKTTLAVKQDSYAAAQLKYTQGTISYNALLDAQDAVDEAQDTVDTAAVDLFTYYNNYRWAVKSGILN